MAINIIFDFDGVIEDTFNFHIDKIKKFAKIEFTENEFREIHNKNFFQNSSSKFEKIDWFKYKNFIYPEISNILIKKNIKDSLLKLKENNHLHIISSGSDRNILKYLKNNKINNLFTDILGAEFHKNKAYKFKYLLKKHNLKKENCFFITDTLGDILEANEFDLKTIAIDSGYHKKDVLAKGNPFKIISDIKEINNLINKK